jgi:hypothetical protein
MTRVVYVVLSHKNPAQVARLIRLLRTRSDRSHVVLHHDESSTQFPLALLGGLTNIHVMPGRPISWGTFGWVEAILRAMHWTLEHIEFDWLVALSGQDYPIRPLPEIERFLAATETDAFVKGFSLGARPETAGEDLQRYLYRYYRVPGGSRSASRTDSPTRKGATMARRLREAQPLISLKRSPSALYVGIRRVAVPFDEDFRWYRGSTWFTLSHKVVTIVDRFARTNARRMRYFRRQWVPEESFVPTVVLNHPNLRVHPDHLRFIRFGAKAAHPDILTMGDADDMLSSGKHFARKFDISVDERILDLIDERVHAETSA